MSDTRVLVVVLPVSAKDPGAIASRVLRRLADDMQTAAISEETWGVNWIGDHRLGDPKQRMTAMLLSAAEVEASNAVTVSTGGGMAAVFVQPRDVSMEITRDGDVEMGRDATTDSSE